ncbi:MAG: EamA family transporter [Xanthomonadales bacterium]|nr:EamA family transporter [Xanthomonadales bacterium]
MSVGGAARSTSSRSCRASRMHALPGLKPPWPCSPEAGDQGVFGSLVAFTAYLFLLKNVRPLLATSYAYVNPPVAVLLGAIILGEVVHASDVAAMAVILTGVAMITFGKKRE